MKERELFLMHILGCRRVDLFTKPISLTPSQQKQLDAMEQRLKSDEPWQYILGQCDFMGLVLKVTPDVLIPRPETEIVTDAAIGYLRNCPGGTNVLDLGTGSGNIAVAIAKHIPTARVVSVDISSSALQIARTNAGYNGVDEQIVFVCQDMRDFLTQTWSADQKFDMIISNPPYIPEQELARLPDNVRKEPKIALNGGKDGLDFYRIICGHAKRFLRESGILVMEIGDGQHAAVEGLLRAQNFSDIRFLLDHIGTSRVVLAK